MKYKNNTIISDAPKIGSYDIIYSKTDKYYYLIFLDAGGSFSWRRDISLLDSDDVWRLVTDIFTI